MYTSAADGSSLAKLELLRTLAPQLLAISITYLLVGAALASISLFVSRELAYGPFAIGFLTGLSFLFSITLVLVRVFIGSAADRFGRVSTALWSLVVMILGFALMAFAPEKKYALLGAGLAGLG